MSEQEEQQTEKKKASIIKQILKWLGLGLLTLVLTVLITLQAPWKIITLLAIILLACTILPKACRKYFWFSVGCVVIALTIWVFLPENDEGWRPYTFDEELAELQAKYAIPDEENAAIIYNQLIEDYNKASFEPNFTDPNLEYLIRTEFWSDEDYPEAVQWIENHKNTIAILVEASKKDQCRFTICPKLVDCDTSVRLLPMMRKWALLLVSAANNDIAKGRTKEGFEKYFATLQTAKHLYQQPSLLDFLVGSGSVARPTNNLKRFIVTGDATEDRLSIIEQALSEIKYDWRDGWPKILDGEKLFLKNFWGLFYEVNPEGKIRLTRSSANTIIERWEEGTKEVIATTYWHKRLMKASAILHWFYMPSTPQKAGEIIDAAYERYYVMGKPGFDWSKKPREFPITPIKSNCRYIVDVQLYMLEPSFYIIHDVYLKTIAQQRGSRIMIALRRYKNENGNWPESLDEVKSSAPEEIFTDPINGGSFVYKLTEENFILYSKGKNSIDDGGKRDEDEEQTGADDLLIWSS